MAVSADTAIIKSPVEVSFITSGKRTLFRYWTRMKRTCLHRFSLGLEANCKGMSHTLMCHAAGLRIGICVTNAMITHENKYKPWLMNIEQILSGLVHNLVLNLCVYKFTLVHYMDWMPSSKNRIAQTRSRCYEHGETNPERETSRSRRVGLYFCKENISIFRCVRRC